MKWSFLMEPCEHLIQHLSTHFPLYVLGKSLPLLLVGHCFHIPRLVPPIITTPSIDSRSTWSPSPVTSKYLTRQPCRFRVRGLSRLSMVSCNAWLRYSLEPVNKIIYMQCMLLADFRQGGLQLKTPGEDFSFQARCRRRLTYHWPPPIAQTRIR